MPCPGGRRYSNGYRWYMVTVGFIQYFGLCAGRLMWYYVQREGELWLSDISR
jgi:hypothetical protein